jgi:hypothetical protein
MSIDLIPQKRVVYDGSVPVTDYESFTSLSTFYKCPVVFYEHYFKKKREPSTMPMLLGTALHGAIEECLIEKIAGKGCSEDFMEKLFLHHFQVEFNIARRSRDGVAVEGRGVNFYRERGALAIREWKRVLEPDISPRGVEVPAVLTLKAAKRKLFGKLDITDTAPGLIDTKSTSKADWAVTDEVKRQFAIYLAMHKKLYGENPLWMRAHVVGTGSVPRAYPVDVVMTRADIQKIFDEFVIPTMQGIDTAWETRHFKCKCGEHKDTDIVTGRDVIGGDQSHLKADGTPYTADELGRLLDPEKYKGIEKAPDRVEKEPVDPDDLPF